MPSKHFFPSLTLILQIARVQLDRSMIKILKRVLKRFHKKKQYRYERYYFEIPSRFNDLVAELCDRELNIVMEKTQNELWIKLRTESTGT